MYKRQSYGMAEATLGVATTAPEDWVLPGRTFAAATSEDTYRQALRNADQMCIRDRRHYLPSGD